MLIKHSILVVLALFCSLGSLPSNAQSRANLQKPQPVVSLQVSTLQRFETAFSAFSEKTQVTVVAEGTPLRPELSKEAFVALTQQLGIKEGEPSADVPFDRAMEQLALAYDYDAEFSSAKIVLLRKRYRDVEDIPYITVAEAAKSLRNITNLLEQLLPKGKDIDKNSPIVQLISSAMPAQGEQFKVNLSVAKMTLKQKEWAWQLLAQRYLYNSYYSVKMLCSRLEAMDSPKSEFFWRDMTGVRVFCYQVPYMIQNLMLPVALSHGFQTSAGGGTSILIPTSKVRIENDKIINKLPDPTAPAPPPILPLIQPLGCVKTIQQIVDSRNTDGVTNCLVDKELAPKPVSLFGVDKLDNRSLLEVVAAVYGLQVSQPQAGVFLIRMQRPPARIDFASVQSVVDKLLPLPYRRALDGGMNREAGAIQDPNKRPSSKLNSGRYNGSRALYTASVKRLRALVQPDVPDDGKTTLPISETDDDIHCLLAVSALSTSFLDTDALTRRSIPLYLTDFERMEFEFHVEIKGNRTEIGWGVGPRDKEGAFLNQGGSTMSIADFRMGR